MDYSSFQPSWWTWIHLKEVFVIWYVTYSFSSAVQLFSILCLYSGSINTHTLKSYTWSCTAHRTGFVDFFPLNESEIIESDPGLKIRAQQLSLFSFTLYIHCVYVQVMLCRCTSSNLATSPWQQVWAKSLSSAVGCQELVPAQNPQAAILTSVLICRLIISS